MRCWALGAGLLLVAGCSQHNQAVVTNTVVPPSDSGGTIVAVSATELEADRAEGGRGGVFDAPVRSGASQTQPRPPFAASDPTVTPAPPSAIDLPTALRLAEAQNPQIQFARERLRAAEAERDRAEVLWLPNLSVGSNWTRHEGQIQDTRGEVITVSRSALFAGGGAAASVDLAEALYAPLAARQLVAARQAGERVATNDTLLEVALGYWELVRAQANLVIAAETRGQARQLDDLAQSYLKADKLKPADAERIRAELRFRDQEVEAASERLQVASVRLAELLRLDPFVTLRPADAKAVPVTLVDEKVPVAVLAGSALAARPELAQNRALVAWAAERLQQAQNAPWLPRVQLGYRAGGFGGGPNGFFGDFDSRGDAEAGLAWEWRNLGFGEHALQRQREAEVRQARWHELAELDRVLAGVAAALARSRARHAQLDAAAQAAHSANRSYQLSLQLFKEVGLDAIRPIEVLQAIQSLARAGQDQVNLIVDYNRAQSQLHWALGWPVVDSDGGNSK